jgi:hypothetical protein
MGVKKTGIAQAFVTDCRSLGTVAVRTLVQEKSVRCENQPVLKTRRKTHWQILSQSPIPGFFYIFMGILKEKNERITEMRN